MQIVKRMFGRKDGSVLVGAVALGAVMAVGVAGLMGISRNTVGQEFDANKDAQAFLAAETGLLIGTNWYKNQTASVPTDHEFGIMVDGIPVNGTPVKIPVTIRVENSPEPNEIRLTSTATVEGLAYDKQLEWTVNANISQGTKAGDDQTHVSDPKGLDFKGGDVYYGRLHFNNSPLRIHNATRQNNSNATRFYGLVTVCNAPGTNAYGYGQGAKGNFSEGIFSPTGAPKLEDLDATFVGRFETNQKQYEMVFNHGDADETVILEQSKNVQNARLEFNGSSVTFGVSGNIQTINIDPNKRTIIEAPFDGGITVSDGVMNGFVTVWAKGNITIDLSKGTNCLIYGGMNTTGIKDAGDMKLGKNSSSVLQNDDERKANHRVDTVKQKSALGFYSDNGDIVLDAPDKKEFGILTAQLYAPKGTISFVNAKAWVRVIGVSAMKYWWNSEANNNGQANFVTLEDKRGINTLPGLGTTDQGGSTVNPDNDGKLVKTKWKETNIPRA